MPRGSVGAGGASSLYVMQYAQATPCYDDAWYLNLLAAWIFIAIYPIGVVALFALVLGERGGVGAPRPPKRVGLVSLCMRPSPLCPRPQPPLSPCAWPRPLSVLMFLAFLPFAHPLLFFAAHFARKGLLRNDAVRAGFGFLYEPFRPNFWCGRTRRDVFHCPAWTRPQHKPPPHDL